MGLTALLLAGGTAFATKNTYRASYWYLNGSTCTPITSTKVCTQQGDGCTGTEGASIGQQLYSDNSCFTSLRQS